VTRADLIERICETRQMIRSRAELLVDTIFDCLKQSIRRGEKIELRGFGTFQVRSYSAFKGRNPRNGQIVEVKPKRLPHFRTSIALAARINERRGKSLEETTVAPSET
jgi:integration host factor subunit beta